MIYGLLLVLIFSYSSFADNLLKEGDYKHAAEEYMRAIYAGEGDSLWTKVVYAYEKSGDYDRAYYFMNRYKLDDMTVGRISFWVGDTIKIKNISSPYREYYMGLFYLSAGMFEKTLNTLPDDSVCKPIKETIKENMNFSHKYPVLAGVMSTIIPGTGRMYAGDVKDGFFSMFMCGVMAGASYYYWKTGSPILSAVTGAAFVGFYLGDIYGAFVSAVKYNRWQKIKLIKKVYDISQSHYLIYP